MLLPREELHCGELKLEKIKCLEEFVFLLVLNVLILVTEKVKEIHIDLNKFIEVEPSMEVEKDCPLEEVDFQSNSKENHRAAIKQIYQILQKKGMNEDSMHDANCYLNQYLKDLKNQ